MDNNIKEHLDLMVGKSFHYEKQNIKILKYKEIAGNVCIVTDQRTFQFYPEEFYDNFLNKISDAKEPGSFSPPSEIEKKSFVALPEENLKIKDTLMEALKKVKEDPSFLLQAKAICEITNTMVNIQKTEIELIKLQKDL